MKLPEKSSESVIPWDLPRESSAMMQSGRSSALSPLSQATPYPPLQYISAQRSPPSNRRVASLVSDPTYIILNFSLSILTLPFNSLIILYDKLFFMSSFLLNFAIKVYKIKKICYSTYSYILNLNISSPSAGMTSEDDAVL